MPLENGYYIFQSLKKTTMKLLLTAFKKIKKNMRLKNQLTNQINFNIFGLK